MVTFDDQSGVVIRYYVVIGHYVVTGHYVVIGHTMLSLGTLEAAMCGGKELLLVCPSADTHI